MAPKLKTRLQLEVRQHSHGIGSIYNFTQMGTFRPCVYTGPPSGTASCTQMGPFTKSIPFGSVPGKVLCKQVEQFQMGRIGNEAAIHCLTA